MTAKPRHRKISPDELYAQLIAPRVAAVKDLDSLKRVFAPPATMSGKGGRDARMAMDAAFDAAGGYDAIYESLLTHAADLGQYPLTSFIGYGALQQIAQQGMIRACIQTTADDMARKWITLDGVEDASRIEEEMQRLRLQEVFHEAWATVGYMGGAFIFIDTGAGDDDLRLPLVVDSLSAELQKDAPLRFILIDPVNASPAEYNATDPLRGDYMRPQRWWIQGRLVHASRLIRLADNEPPLLLRPNYNFLGIPQSQILWDYVLHFNDCRTAAAALLKKISLLVVKTDMDALLSDPSGVMNFDAKMEVLKRYRDNDSIFACDKDSEDVTNVQTSIAGCTDIVRQALEMIAAINRTPAVKLLGISPSGFNATGESDITNYYDMISARQEGYRADIQRCLDAIQLVTWGRIDPDLHFAFAPLHTENENASAMTAQTRIGAWAQLADRQAISAEELRQAARNDPLTGLGFIDPDLPEDAGGGDPFGGLEGEGAEPGAAAAPDATAAPDAAPGAALDTDAEEWA